MECNELPAVQTLSEKNDVVPWLKWNKVLPMDDQISEDSCCYNPCDPGHDINRRREDPFARKISRQEVNRQVKFIPLDVTLYQARHFTNSIKIHDSEMSVVPEMNGSARIMNNQY